MSNERTCRAQCTCLPVPDEELLVVRFSWSRLIVSFSISINTSKSVVSMLAGRRPNTVNKKGVVADKMIRQQADSDSDSAALAERLTKLKLFSVQGRLLRTDLIQHWKILNNHSCIAPNILFSPQPHPTPRRDTLKILTPHVSTDTRQRFFTYRYIRLWNCPPEEAACACNL